MECVAAVPAASGEDAPLDAIRKRRVVAFCGLGNPDSFWRNFEDLGIKLIDRIRFQDHHRYSTEDVGRILTIAQQHQAQVLITTEKDLVNLVHAIDAHAIDPEQLSKQPLDVRASELFGATPLAWMRVRVVVDQGNELLDWIEERMRARLSGVEDSGPRPAPGESTLAESSRSDTEQTKRNPATP